MIYFNEKLHRYTNIKGEVYTSATTFIAKFYKHFEETEKFWSLYKAIQYLSDIDKPVKIKKYDTELDAAIGQVIFSAADYGKIIQYTFRQCDKDDAMLRSYFSARDLAILDRAVTLISAHWKKVNLTSTDKGTAFHNWKEAKLFSDGFYHLRGSDYNVVERNKTRLDDLLVGVHPEVRMWNDHYFLAGTADQVIVLPGRKVIIRDYKTNAELKIENKYQKMLDPISHLDDCNMVHYQIQLSIYGWMLEQFGYEVVGMEIEHYELEKEGEEQWRIIDQTNHGLEYIPDMVKKMLKHGGHEV